MGEMDVQLCIVCIEVKFNMRMKADDFAKWCNIERKQQWTEN